MLSSKEEAWTRKHREGTLEIRSSRNKIKCIESMDTIPREEIFSELE